MINSPMSIRNGHTLTRHLVALAITCIADAQEWSKIKWLRTRPF